MYVLMCMWGEFGDLVDNLMRESGKGREGKRGKRGGRRKVKVNE